MPWRALLLLASLLAAPGPAAAGETAHTARPGDTPAALAKQYHVPAAAIMARNQGLDPCRIKVGDVIVIPDAPAAPGTIASPPKGGAPKADASSPDVAPAPAAPKNAAAPVATPQKAALPDEEAPERRYVVVPGDCPAAIAERFDIPLDALERANPGLDPRRLPVGCVLTVPEGSACAPPAVPVTRPGEPGSRAPLVMDFQ